LAKNRVSNNVGGVKQFSLGDKPDNECDIKYNQNQQFHRLRRIQSLFVYTASESAAANRIWKDSIPLALIDLLNPFVRLAPERHTEGC
jgi:hypothetical protein